MEKYIRVIKENISHVLVLILCLSFSLHSPASGDDKFDITQSEKVIGERVGLVRDGKVYSSQEAYKKLYPECKTYKSCKDQYQLLSVALYKARNGIYFYSIKVIDYSRKGQRGRVVTHQIKAEKKQVQKVVEEDNVEQ